MHSFSLPAQLNGITAPSASSVDGADGKVYPACIAAGAQLVCVTCPADNLMGQLLSETAQQPANVTAGLMGCRDKVVSSHSLHGDKSKRDRSQTLTVAQGVLSMDELALSRLDLSQFLEVGYSGLVHQLVACWVDSDVLLFKLATPAQEASDCSACLASTLTPAVLSIGPLAADSSIGVSPAILTCIFALVLPE